MTVQVSSVAPPLGESAGQVKGLLEGGGRLTGAVTVNVACSGS
jgi:hypothetical protein